jgi:hypothetical protein
MSPAQFMFANHSRRVGLLTPALPDGRLARKLEEPYVTYSLATRLHRMPRVPSETPRQAESKLSRRHRNKGTHPLPHRHVDGA